MANNEIGGEMREVDLKYAYRLVNNGPCVLVTVNGPSYPNIISIAWVTPVCSSPPLVAISVRKERYSHDLIMKEKEFTINIPDESLLNAIWVCGTKSGSEVDKFKAARLTPMKGKNVKCPWIRECVAFIECKLKYTFDIGRYTIFVGEIVHAEAKEGVFGEYWDIDKVKIVHHLGGNNFEIDGKLKKV